MEQNILFKGNIKKQFVDIFKQLEFHFGCTYMAYIFEDQLSLKRISFATHPKWQEFYLENQMIESCHIYQEGLRRFSISDEVKMIVPWDLLKPQNMAQRDVVFCRQDAEIYHGISFCAKFEGVQEMMGLATEKSHNKFPRLILDNVDSVHKYVLLLRYIARQHLKKDLWGKEDLNNIDFHSKVVTSASNDSRFFTNLA